MNDFKSLFILELKNICRRRNLFLLGVCCLLLVVVVQDGIRHYHDVEEEVSKFMETLNERVEGDLNGIICWEKGFRLPQVYPPDPLGILFNSQDDNFGIRLNVDGSESDQFRHPSSDWGSNGYVSYPGILLMIGCLLALSYGFRAFRSSEYLKLLSSVMGPGRMFFSLLVSRIFLFNGAALLASFLPVVLAKIQGVDLLVGDLFGFLMVMMLCFTFFVVIGAMIANTKGDYSRMIWLFSVYIVSVFIIPMLLDVILESDKGLAPMIIPTTFFKACVMILGSHGFLNFKFFGVGVIINLFGLFVLCIATYFFFKRILFRISGTEMDSCAKLEIDLEKNTVNVWRIKGESPKNLLFKLFSGQNRKLKETGFTGKVCLAGNNIVQQRCEESFIYFCNSDEIPGEIRVKDLIYFFGALGKVKAPEINAIIDNKLPPKLKNRKFKQLSDIQRCETLMVLTHLYYGDLIYINVLTANMSAYFATQFKDRLEQLRKKGACVLYLTSVEDSIIAKTSGNQNSYFEYTSLWVDLVECYRDLLMKKENNQPHNIE
jgi:ABC-type multidrug transport system permease subunit